MLQCCVLIAHSIVTFVNNLGSQNVLDVNEPVLIVRPDDGPIGPKHVALYVLLIVIIAHSTVTFVNHLGSQNVLDVNKPVLIVRPDDGPIGPKHVALYVLLIVIIDVLDKNINTLFIHLKSLLFFCESFIKIGIRRKYLVKISKTLIFTKIHHIVETVFFDRDGRTDVARLKVASLNCFGTRTVTCLFTGKQVLR